MTKRSRCGKLSKFAGEGNELKPLKKVKKFLTNTTNGDILNKFVSSEVESLKKDFERNRKKFLTKLTRCAKIAKLVSERRVPCKLNNVTLKAPEKEEFLF